MYPNLNPVKLYACPERPRIDDAALRRLYGFARHQRLSYDYDTDGVFSQQFSQLYGILTTMIRAEDRTAVVPAYRDIARYFASAQLHGAFVNLKKMMEKVIYHLQQLSSNQVDGSSQGASESERKRVKKRAYLNRIATDLTVCGPGIFANFQQVLAELETRETLVDWLVRIRGEVFEQLCRSYCERNHIGEVMEVHAGVTLRNYACEKGWSIHGDNIPNTDDPYARRIADGDKAWVEAEFTQNYNFQLIWSWVSGHVLFNINDLLRTNLHITDREDFDHKAGLFLHEVGIEAAEAFGFVESRVISRRQDITVFKQEMIPLLVCKGLLDYFEVDDKALKESVESVCDNMREFLRSWPKHDECAPSFIAVARAMKEVADSEYVEIANGLFDELFKAKQWSKDFVKHIVEMLNSGDKERRDLALNIIDQFVLKASPETRSAIADSLVTYFTPENARSNGNASLSALQSLMEREDECRTIFAPMLLGQCIESESGSRNKAAQSVIKQYEKSIYESKRVIVAQAIKLCAESSIRKVRDWVKTKATQYVKAREETVQDTASKTMLLCALSNRPCARYVVAHMIEGYAKAKITEEKAVNEIYSLATMNDDNARESVADAIRTCANYSRDAVRVAANALKRCLVSRNGLAIDAVLQAFMRASEYRDEVTRCLVFRVIEECVLNDDESVHDVVGVIVKSTEHYKELAERIVLYDFISKMSVIEDQAKVPIVRAFVVSVVVQCAKSDSKNALDLARAACSTAYNSEDDLYAMALRGCFESRNPNALKFALDQIGIFVFPRAEKNIKIMRYILASESEHKLSIFSEVINYLITAGNRVTLGMAAKLIVDYLKSESRELRTVADQNIDRVVNSDQEAEARVCGALVVELLNSDQERLVAAAADIVLRCKNPLCKGYVKCELEDCVKNCPEQNIVLLVKNLMQGDVFEIEQINLVVKMIMLCMEGEKQDVIKRIIEECVRTDSAKAITIIKGLLAYGEPSNNLLHMCAQMSESTHRISRGRYDLMLQWFKSWVMIDEKDLDEFAKEALKQLVNSKSPRHTGFVADFVGNIVISADLRLRDFARDLIGIYRAAEYCDARYEMADVAMNLLSNIGEDFDAHAAVAKIIQSVTQSLDNYAVGTLDTLIGLCLNLRIAEQLQYHIDEMLPIITLQFAESADPIMRQAVEGGICALRSVGDVYKTVLIQCIESESAFAQDTGWKEMFVWWNRDISFEIRRSIVERCCESQNPRIEREIKDVISRWAQIGDEDIRGFVVSTFMHCLRSNTKGAQNIAMSLVPLLAQSDNAEVRQTLFALFGSCIAVSEDKLIVVAVTLLKKCAESNNAQAISVVDAVIRGSRGVDGRIYPIAEKTIFQCALSRSDGARNVVVNSMRMLASNFDVNGRARVIEIIRRCFCQANSIARATTLEALVLCAMSDSSNAIAVAREVMLRCLLAVDDEINAAIQYILLACVRSDFDSAREMALIFLFEFLELHAQDIDARVFVADVISASAQADAKFAADTCHTILEGCLSAKQSHNRIGVIINVLLNCLKSNTSRVRDFAIAELVEYASSSVAVKEHIVRKVVMAALCGGDISVNAIHEVISKCTDGDSHPRTSEFIAGLVFELMTLRRQQEANDSEPQDALKLVTFCVFSSNVVLQQNGFSALLEHAYHPNNSMVAGMLLRWLRSNEQTNVDAASRLIYTCVISSNSCAVRMVSDVMIELFESAIPEAKTAVADLLISFATAESQVIREWGSEILQRGLSLSDDYAFGTAQEIIYKCAQYEHLHEFIIAAIYGSFDPFDVNVGKNLFFEVVCRCAESDSEMVRNVGFSVIGKLIEDKLRFNHIESTISNILERCICSANIAAHDFTHDRLIHATSLRDTPIRDLAVNMMAEWLSSSRDEVREVALKLVFDCAADNNEFVRVAAVFAIARAVLRDRRDDLITICARSDNELVRNAAYAVIDEVLNPHSDFSRGHASRVKTVIVKAISLCAESEEPHDQDISHAMFKRCDSATSRLGIEVAIEAIAQCAKSEKKGAQNIARWMLERCFVINGDAVAIRKGEEGIRRLDFSRPYSPHKDIAQHGFSLRAAAIVQGVETNERDVEEVRALLEQYIDSSDKVQNAIAQEVLLRCTFAHPLNEDHATTKIANDFIARINSEDFLFALINRCVQSGNPNAHEFAFAELIRLAREVSDCQITDQNLVASRFVNYFIASKNKDAFLLVERILDYCLSAEGMEVVVEQRQRDKTRVVARKGLRSLVLSSKQDEQRIAFEVLQRNFLSRDLETRNSVNDVLKEGVKSGIDDVATLVMNVVRSALVDEERGKVIVLDMIMEWAKSPDQETNEAALSVLRKLSESSASVVIATEMVKTCASSAEVALTQFVSKLFEQWLLSNNSNMQLLLSTNLVNCVVNRDPKALEVVSAFFVQQVSFDNLQVCGKVLAVVTKQCAKRDLHPLFELMLRKADRITDEKIRGCLGDINDFGDNKFRDVYVKPISDILVHSMYLLRQSAREYQRPRLFSPSRHAPIVAERADALALFGALFKDDANAVATILRRQSFKKGRLKEIADYFKQPLVQDRMFSSLP